MKRSVSVHLTMTVRVGTNIRVDALVSINTGSGPERVELRELASNEDGLTKDGFSASKAVCLTTKRLMQRVSDELSKRGLNASAKEIEHAFREDTQQKSDDYVQTLHAVLDFADEINRHTFWELQGE